MPLEHYQGLFAMTCEYLVLVPFPLVASPVVAVVIDLAKVMEHPDEPSAPAFVPLQSEVSRIFLQLGYNLTRVYIKSTALVSMMSKGGWSSEKAVCLEPRWEIFRNVNAFWIIEKVGIVFLVYLCKFLVIVTKTAKQELQLSLCIGAGLELAALPKLDLAGDLINSIGYPLNS